MKERLEAAFALIRFILERRRAMEDSGLGSSIERCILARELGELEADLQHSNSVSVSPPRDV